MEKELKDYLEQSFEKLVTKEELKKELNDLRVELRNETSSLRGEIVDLRNETSNLRNEVNDLRVELRSETSSLRGEMKELESRVIHQFHITAEALRDDIKQVAEGVMNLNEKFGREMSRLREEMNYSHEELKAMIKFSYSELDRRLTALEVEFEKLKQRVEKIETKSSHT